MIMQTKNIQVETNQETDDFEINNEDGHLYSVLSELYSDPIGSTCREIASNCNDAHKMNNNEERPFIIKLPNTDKGINEIAFRDFGPGLTDSQVKNIYKVYGVSTKNKLNNVTGCLGLGSKSPYSISSTFYVKSYLNGKVYLYTCAQNNAGKPNITKVPTVMDTDEENGLEVIIPFYQQVNFANILTKVLKYFKVKPLVYKQMGNLEDDELVDINWDKLDNVVKLTDTIYVNPLLLQQQSYMNNKLPKVKSEVIQLQIYYGIDKEMISHTIDRFNRAFIKISGEVNNNFKISDSRKKIIMFLLDYGIKFYSEPGKIAFSPSRENIKYTDYTLEYLIVELNRAAKIIERIIFKNFNNLSGDFETFYNNLVLNYDKYFTYLDFCSKFDINTKVTKQYDSFNDIIYKIEPKFDYILCEFNKTKEKYKETDIYQGFQNFFPISYTGIRNFHKNLNNKKIMVMDLFTKDLLKKIPNINSNSNIIVSAMMTDTFKNKLYEIFNTLLKDIEIEVEKNSLEYLNIVYENYNKGEINYTEFKELADFRGICFDLEFTNSVDNGIAKIKSQVLNYISDKFNNIRQNNKFFSITENNKITQLNSNYKEYTYIALANYEHSLLKIYSEVYNLFEELKNNDSKNFNSIIINFYYTLGKLLNYYDGKKNKIKSLTELSLYESFNIGKMTRFVELLDKGTYSDDKHIFKYRDDFLENQDTIFKDFGILKFKNNLLIYLMVYIVKKLINESPNLITEQLSLANYDLTSLIRKDLAQFNIPNMETKILSEVKNTNNKIATVRDRKATFRNIKNLSINSSEYLLIDYTKDECLEFYEYMKLFLTQFLKFRLINDGVDSIVRSVPTKNLYYIDDTFLYPNEFLNNQEIIKIAGEDIESKNLNLVKDNNSSNPKISFMYKNDTTRDEYLYPSIENDKTWYTYISNLLEEDFSIRSYNNVFRSFVREVKNAPITGVQKFDNYLLLLKKYTKVGSIPFCNSLIHHLPNNYNFEPMFICLDFFDDHNFENDTLQIDNVHFGKIVDILNSKKNLIYPSKIYPKLESKTLKKFEYFEHEFEFITENIKFNETPYATILTKVFKELIPNIGFKGFYNIIQNFNNLNSENIICLRSTSNYVNFIKKNTYNFYQFSLIIMRDFLKKYTLSDYKAFDMDDKNFREKLIYYTDPRKNYNSDVLNSKFDSFYRVSMEQKNMLTNFLNLMFDEKIINNKNIPNIMLQDNYKKYTSFDLFLIIIQLRLDYDLFFKLFMDKIPLELVGTKLQKEFKNSFNNIYKIKVKSYIDIFGKNFVDKLQSIDFKKVFEQAKINIKKDTEFLENTQEFINSCVEEFNILIMDTYKNEITNINSFKIIKKTFTDYINAINISMVDNNKQHYKIDILRNFDSEDLKFFNFLGDFLNNISNKKIEITNLSKIFAFSKFNKLIDIRDETLKRELMILNDALRKENSKEAIKKIYLRKKLHALINKRTAIENRKNKGIKLKIVPTKKYHIQ